LDPKPGRRRLKVDVSDEEFAWIEAAHAVHGRQQKRASFIRRLLKLGLAALDVPVPVADPAVAAPRGTIVHGAAEELARVEAELEAERADEA
jgi:hypothetical protein